MNIYIESLDHALQDALVFLDKKLKIDNIYSMTNLIYPNRKDIQEQFKSRIRIMYLYQDAIAAQYQKYPYYKEALPVDKDILDKMAIYEPEILKMMDRGGTLCEDLDDRFIVYHENIRYWNYMLDAAKIDLVILCAIPHDVFDYILYRLAEIKRIPVILGEKMPLVKEQRHIFYYDYKIENNEFVHLLDSNKERYKERDKVNLPDIVQEEFDFFVNSSETLVKVAPPRNPKIYRDYKALFKYYYGLDKKVAWHKVKHRIEKSFQDKRLLKYYNKLSSELNLNTKYIYFPLQYQPELSTCPKGEWFVHQYLAIEMLSYYLPSDVQIIVKEHPAIILKPVHSRKKSLYDQIKKLKNVHFAPIDANSMELMEKSIAVASITGNIGYEAMFKLKPFIMFGYTIMRYAPGTLVVRNNEECACAVEKIIDGKVIYSLKDVAIFLKTVYESSFAVSLVDHTISNSLIDEKRGEIIAGQILEMLEESNYG